MAAASKDSQPRATYYLFPSPSKQPDLAKVNFKVPPATTVNLDGTASRPPVQPAGKGRFKARVRRSGEKFLYYLGFKSSPIAPKAQTVEPVSPLSVNTNLDGPLQDSGAGPEAERRGSKNRTFHRGSSSGRPAPSRAPGDIRHRHSEFFESFAAAHRWKKGSSNGQSAKLDSEFQETPVSGGTGFSMPSTLRRTKSTPGLAHRLSTKLSTTFGKSTVVHHAHLRSRPSVQVTELHVTMNALNNQGDSANDSSDPSTPFSGSGSPAARTKSTPPTSEEASPDRSKRALDNEDQNARTRILTPICEWDDPDLTPSISTVERTANAKVYFESHFDSMSSDTHTRETREREFTAYTDSLRLTEGERVKAREEWVQQESNHLRQCRVLHSLLNASSDVDAVAHAGYEASEVLGRGSFGVVRMVRDKQDPDHMPFKITGRRRGSESSLYVPKRRRCLAGEKKKVFAMKVIRKSEMIRNSQEGHVKAERDFLVGSQASRWAVPLIASFQDNDNLYLIMDYMVGGDFLGLLIRKNILSEEWTKFYLAEMVVCIEEAHRLRWIHRDVKPDNFLIDASGHLRISDFGLAFNGHWAHDQTYYNTHRYSMAAKLGIPIEGDIVDMDEAAKFPTQGQDVEQFKPEQRIDRPTWGQKLGRRKFAKSVVGTSQYMAPEVIRGEHYDGRCDWWSIGIILYECLYGFTPFACEDRHDTKIKILRHLQTLHFPDDRPTDRLVSVEAMDLIAQLLTDKSSRLGSGPYRAIDYLMKRQGMMNNFVEKPREYDLPCYVYPEAAEDIKSHPFFEGINFKTIHRGQPPFVPKVTGWGDMRYFEDGGDYPFMEDINIDEDEPGSDISHFADGAALPTSKHRENAHTQGESDSNAGASDKKHENKAKRPRARDKILRDLKTGTEAMEIRKHGIFAGYEYVRPNKPRPINPFTGKPLRKVYETATPRPLKYDLEYQLGPLDD